LSTKSGLGNPTNALKVSVTKFVHRNSWNKRKPFLKSTPKMTTMIIGIKYWGFPILVIGIMN
jgi:hypothetical protein